MTVDASALLKDLKKQVTSLEADLRATATDDAEVAGRLRAEHRAATEVGRTATPYVSWLDSQVTQAAVAWVLGTVFVRFCEDNGLIAEPWLAGPAERTALAADRQRSHFLQNPLQNDKDWLLAAFDHLKSFPAVAALFDDCHNPFYRLTATGDGARDLIDFWRRAGTNGELVHDLTDDSLSTRFLGDLYQDMSEAARKQFALLQTPDFVEELILDLTLDPAIDEFGLERLRMIDPTCGSGHFLLGAFHRLLDRWGREKPGMDVREQVQAALDSVHGVDVNPFATAISKFRLTVEAMRASGVKTLAAAPGYRLNIATGDSLLWEQGGLQAELPSDADGEGLAAHQYSAEDLFEFPDILKPGRYQAVVGNPPYIIVSDKALNQAYRKAYPICSRKYALSVPFADLFFRLGVNSSVGSAFVGQITSNSFMKREFGKPLVEQYLPTRDLTHVIDTSGAYIPGHGTPTVILVGRTRRPERSTLRAVLGVRGEPATPAVPADGIVWRAIVDNLDDPSHQGEFVTVVDLPRSGLSLHPWSLSGGGAGQVMDVLSAGRPLGSSVDEFGFSDITGDDDVFVVPNSGAVRQLIGSVDTEQFVEGVSVRDWTISGDCPSVILPVTWQGQEKEMSEGASRHLWCFKAQLGRRIYFGKTSEQRGLRWFDHAIFQPGKHSNTSLISYAFVATHNHFVLNRKNRLFNKSAPVIKLPAEATEEDHLGLLAVLNSSTACFWLKQQSYDKGTGGEAWERRIEVTGTTLEDFPLPDSLAGDYGRRLDDLQQVRAASSPAAVAERGVPSRTRLDDARRSYESLTRQMIFWQEELDWATYRLYGLIDEDLTYHGEPVELSLGERAFEIFLGRSVAKGNVPSTAWFDRHGSTMLTAPPSHWPKDYHEVYFKRHEALQEAPLKLIERPECKRRWASDTWEQMEKAALRDWLLDRLESKDLWFSQGRPRIRSVAQVADDLASDADFSDVVRLWAGAVDVDLTVALGQLLAGEHVPFLAAHRYKESGLRTREAWEETWELQRREDDGETLDVPVPPKYKQADFVKPSYWKHRGKLDVPKERFISYPGAERGADRTTVLGWAGWDHAGQALALATYARERQRTDAWSAEQLVPLWAGVAEVEPWVRQWHSEVDTRMGQSPAAAVSAILDQALSQLGVTRADLAAWRPLLTGSGRRPRATKENA